MGDPAKCLFISKIARAIIMPLRQHTFEQPLNRMQRKNTCEITRDNVPINSAFDLQAKDMQIHSDSTRAGLIHNPITLEEKCNVQISLPDFWKLVYFYCTLARESNEQNICFTMFFYCSTIKGGLVGMGTAFNDSPAQIELSLDLLIKKENRRKR